MAVLLLVIVVALMAALLAPASPAAAQDDGPTDSSSALTPTEPGDATGNSDGGGGSGDDGRDRNLHDIVFPVVGPVWFTDTWGACRGARCSRSHKGVDIFALKLTPVVAAADGVITHNRQSALTTAGNTVIIKGDDGWRYLYLHLNNDSPGTDDNSNPQGWILPNRLRVGDRVEAGDVVGYLGDSGNAEKTPSHLHFEMHRPGQGPTNPTPSVQWALDRGRRVSVASLASPPEGRAEHAPLVSAWYRALLKREPTELELFAWTDRMDIGFATRDDLIADLTMAKPRRDRAGTVVRAFAVVLDRRPAIEELRQWEDHYRNGAGLAEISAQLLAGEEFETKGSLGDEAFIRLLYLQALDREPSAERLEHWLTELGDGAPRSALATYLADSYSVKDRTWHGLEVMQAFRAGLDRLPTDEEYERWVAHLDAGGLIPDVVATIRAERDAARAAAESEPTAETTESEPEPAAEPAESEPAAETAESEPESESEPAAETAESEPAAETTSG